MAAAASGPKRERDSRVRMMREWRKDGPGESTSRVGKAANKDTGQEDETKKIRVGCAQAVLVMVLESRRKKTKKTNKSRA